MKKVVAKKLGLKKDTLAILSANELACVDGAAYTDAVGCVETVPRSFCVCPTKNICTINC